MSADCGGHGQAVSGGSGCKFFSEQRDSRQLHQHCGGGSGHVFGKTHRCKRTPILLCSTMKGEETQVIFEANILSLEEVCVSGKVHPAHISHSMHIPFLMGRSGPVNIDEWALQCTPLQCDSCKDFSQDK